MTITPSEVAKLQKHNADLVRENETLTRDNAELRRQVEAIKQAAINNAHGICAICKHRRLFSNEEPCLSCNPQNHALEYEPPDA